MEASLLGENLIFLISQPRAGSTLLQRILGGHPEIHTVSEPWIMLHPLYALRRHGLRAEYNQYLYQVGLQEFLANEGSYKETESLYIEGIRRMCGYFYSQKLSDTGKRFFLDKTPRYYLIIPELYRTFPKAKYIILIRNPLAVLTSMIKSWTEGDWFWFSDTGIRLDLMEAPKLLLQGVHVLNDSGIVVHYEKLVTSPEASVKNIMDFLGVHYSSQLINYGVHNLSHWKHGDQDNVYDQIAPVPDNAQKWQRHINGPQTWRLLNEYLNTLGKELIREMGYSYDEYEEMLTIHEPKVKMQLTLSLSFLLRTETERAFAERNLVRLIKRSNLLAKS